MMLPCLIVSQNMNKRLKIASNIDLAGSVAAYWIDHIQQSEYGLLQL